MINNSWKDLEPLRIEGGNIEDFDSYYQRIQAKKEYSHIPILVFKQWLWVHHDKEESIKNYGWLDYKDIEFELCSWSNEQLNNLYILKEYRDYFNNRSKFENISDFRCNSKDKNKWQSQGTWNTPPIILDIESLGTIQKEVELVPPYQLVEGHSRYGYLHSMFKIESSGLVTVSESHEIYLMKKSTNKIK